MKRIGLIVFALLALAIAVPVVLIATLPTAKVTIVAIRPTGKFATWTNPDGKAATGREWLFGITNVGRATGYWNAAVHVRRLDRSEEHTVLEEWHEGVLKTREGFVTSMIVTGSDQTEWCGWVFF